MKNLEEIRAKVDAVDEKLLEHFEERMALVKLIAEYKIANHLPIYSGTREQDVMDRALAHLKNDQLADYTREYFTALMNISKDLQGRLLGEENLRLLREQGGRIVYPGPEGSFSGQAAQEFFGENAVAEAVSSFKEVCVQVAGGKAKYGVLPIENSITGSVLEVIDRIEEFDCFVVGEHRVRIKHCLMGLPDAELTDIQTVFSHPQGLSQCRDYLMENNFTQKEAQNTAIAAKQVKESNNKSFAAIASEAAAKLYGLRILDYHIQRNANNYTRFVIIAKEYSQNPDSDKVSISFVVANQPGALYHVLSLFDSLKLNIIRLESRPIPEKPWEYKFYLDFNARSDDERIAKVFGQLQLGCGSFRIIGMYKSHEEAKG